VLLTPAATLRSPIATAPLVAAVTLLVWRTSPRPAVSHSSEQDNSGSEAASNEASDQATGSQVPSTAATSGLSAAARCSDSHI